MAHICCKKKSVPTKIKRCKVSPSTHSLALHTFRAAGTVLGSGDSRVKSTDVEPVSRKLTLILVKENRRLAKI